MPSISLDAKFLRHQRNLKYSFRDVEQRYYDRAEEVLLANCYLICSNTVRGEPEKRVKERVKARKGAQPVLTCAPTD